MSPIAIIIPTYNRADVIGEAIESALAQTLGDIEIVVVDDGSSDGTPEVVSGYAPRVRYIRQKNGGCASARNAGIRATTAPYLLCLDSDDILERDACEQLAQCLDDHPDAGLAYGDHDRLGELAEPGRFFDEHLGESGMIASGVLRRFVLTAACSVMFRRECLGKAGMFDESLRFAEDTDFWLRLCARYRAVFVPRVISHVRIAATSKHRNPVTAERNCADKVRIIERFVGQHPEVAAELSPGELSRLRARPYFDTGVWALRHGERRKARRLLGSSLARCKTYPQAYWYYLLTFLPWAVVDRFAGRLKSEAPPAPKHQPAPRRQE
jgi:glycosyltransferase involved in cell wall biosynthesis